MQTALRLSGRRRPGPRPFRQLRACPSFPEVHQRLLRGDSALSVAEWLASTGEYRGASATSLRSVLGRYRQSLPPGEVLSRAAAPMIEAAKYKLARGLSELAALQELHETQQARIAAGVAAERRIGKLLRGTRREIDIDREILVAAALIKRELGLTGRPRRGEWTG